MVGLGTVMVLAGVIFSLLMCYEERIMRLKVYWKSNLLPSWTWLALTSFCRVLCPCHSFRGCALPSSLQFHLLQKGGSFRPMWSGPWCVTDLVCPLEQHVLELLAAILGIQ